MKQIIGKAGTGKTKELIEEAVANNGIIVCEFPERVKEKAAAYGYYFLPVISYTEFIAFDIDPNKKYYVKNINKLLESMNVSGYTNTTD